MKILMVPIISERIKSEYEYGDNQILEKVYDLKAGKDDSQEIEKELREYRLYDLSNIEDGKLYNSYDSVKNVEKVDREIHVEVIDYVADISEDEEIKDEYVVAEVSELDYPEDTKVFTFNEVVFTEPEPDMVDIVAKENEELKKKVSQLESRIKTESETNIAMILELFNYVAQI